MQFGKTATTTIPWLHDWMLAKSATNEKVALKSGVSCSSVNKLRRGTPVEPFIAQCIVEALKLHTFEYDKRGPKPWR